MTQLAKRTWRIVAGVVVLLLVVVLTAPLLVYVPPIQQWLVRQVAAIASAETGLQISIERVSLQFPLDLAVDNALVVRPPHDTIAFIGHAAVDVRLLPLLHQQVVVDGLTLSDARVNTLDLISDLQVKGVLTQFSVSSPEINLGTGNVALTDARLSDADVTVLLSDTAAIDTTETEPLLWRIAIDQLTVDRSHISVHLPGDSMLIDTQIGQLLARDGDIDLAVSRYAVGTIDWTGGALAYDLPYEAALPQGLDYNHLQLTDVALGIDSVLYCDPIARLNIRQLAMKERSGLEITSLNGPLLMDATALHTAGLLLTTPYSNIYMAADVDFSVADSVSPGQMRVELDATVAKDDMQPFLAAMEPLPLNVDRLPAWPLSVKGRVQGNMELATIEYLNMELPTAFQAEARGTVARLNDTDHLAADIDLSAKTYNLNFLMPALGMPARQPFTIPSGLTLTGHVEADGPRYTADVRATESQGAVTMKGRYDVKSDAYTADIGISQLNVHHFVPSLPLTLSGVKGTVQGRGTDFLSRATQVEAEVSAANIVYDNWNIGNSHAMVNLKAGHLVADVTSDNELIDGSLCIDGTLQRQSKQQTVDALLTINLNQADMQALRVVEHPLLVGLTGDLKLTSNLTDSHRVSGLMKNIYLRDSVGTFNPENLGVLLNARPDTTYARLQNGNLIVKFDASGPYDRLLTQLTTLADTLQGQVSQRVIDQPRIKQLLPTMRLYVTSGNANPLARMLKESQGIGFNDLLVDLNTSAQTGLNGQGHIYGLTVDSTRIDTVKLTLRESAHGLTYQAQVTNNRRNPQFVFNALADGHLYEHGAKVGLRFYDREKRLGLRIGATAAMENDGLRFTLMPTRPTIGYREYTLNNDNYLFLGRDMRLRANVDLLGDGGTGVKVYSEEQDSTRLQDLTVSLHQIDLGELTTALPYVPHITGTLDGDFHLMMDSLRQMSVASDMQVKTLTYEGSPMGDLAAEFVYLQREDDTHAVNGTLLQDGNEIVLLQGSYTNKKATGSEGIMDGTVTLDHTPLSLINGFIPDQLLGFEGTAEGEITLKGTPSKPIVDGELMLDSAFLVSTPYGVRLRFDNDPVAIEGSKLLLENFTMYAHNDNPLNIQGNIDFSDLDHISMDVRMRAQEFQLINAKQQQGSLTYGRAFVNVFARMSGPLDRLTMRGRLDVLGNTDVTYLMLDSPLSTDNQMDELVRFTDFTDSTQTVVSRPTPDGLNMNLSISIDQGAHVKCGLNVDQTNYVDLFGGGDLRMRYTGTDGLLLTGRYTLTSGSMKYSLPVIPLKTFTIQDGSYVEFTGNPMNPTLNITATERNKATVSTDGGQSRSVAFDCGVVITKTLADMGLQFVISAPEDMSMSNELAAMTAEQRGKLAVTMLTTGMYLADGNTSSFSMNSALSSFLQSEINSITGNALKTLDLSIGMDNTTDASGQMHTDYSFRFAKRFWNNRLNVQIGGKVSTGAEVQGQNQSFFDNVTMEYRLSPTGNQYVKLFYNQNAYDWLEGYTGEYGGGFIWKRKMDHWWEMFRLKSKKQTGVGMMRPATTPRDTTRTIVPRDTTPTVVPRDTTRIP